MKHYDYLMVLMDVEEESREYIEQQIQNYIVQNIPQQMEEQNGNNQNEWYNNF